MHMNVFCVSVVKPFVGFRFQSSHREKFKKNESEKIIDGDESGMYKTSGTLRYRNRISYCLLVLISIKYIKMISLESINGLHKFD